MNYDKKRMSLTLQNIASDMIKLPGQAGLTREEKFCLTMIMLARLNAVLVGAHSPSPDAAIALLKELFRASKRETQEVTSVIEGAKLMGFGTTLPWDMLEKMIQFEEDD